MKQAESSPERRLVIAKDVIRKSDTRVPVPDRRICLERVRNACVGSVAEGIYDVVQITMVLNRIRLILVADTRIDREFACRLPVILNVRGKRNVSKITIAVRFAVSGPGENPRCTGEEGRKIREGVVAIPIGVAVRIDLLPAKTHPELQRMRPSRRDEIIRQREFVLQEPKRIDEVRSERGQAVHTDCNVLTAGKSLLQRSICVRLRLCCVRPGECESEGVEQRSREDMPFLNSGVLIGGAVESRPERNRGRTHLRSGVVNVANEQRVLRGQRVIKTAEIIILVNCLPPNRK